MGGEASGRDAIVKRMVNFVTYKVNLEIVNIIYAVTTRRAVATLFSSVPEGAYNPRELAHPTTAQINVQKGTKRQSHCLRRRPWEYSIR
jgi:hypothetical protein